jgi:hypothetical protein
LEKYLYFSKKGVDQGLEVAVGASAGGEIPCKAQGRRISTGGVIPKGLMPHMAGTRKNSMETGTRKHNMATANSSLNTSLTTIGADDFILYPAALHLAADMRADKFINLKDRRHMFKLYKGTFYHSQGLAWLMNRVAQYEEEKAAKKKGGEPYQRSEDDLLEWKAMAVGNRLRDAGYLIQVSGKHGFKAHRKKNHLFRYQGKTIDRDLAKPSYQNVTPEEMEVARKHLFTHLHCLGDF